MPGENYCEAIAVGTGKVPNFDALKRASVNVPASTGGASAPPPGQAPPPPPAAPRPNRRRGYAMNPFRRPTQYQAAPPRRRTRTRRGRRSMPAPAPAPPTNTFPDVNQPTHVANSNWVPPARHANVKVNVSTPGMTATYNSNGVAGGAQGTGAGSTGGGAKHTRRARSHRGGMVSAAIEVPAYMLKTAYTTVVIKPVRFVIGG